MSLLEGNTFRGPGQRVPDPLPSSRCSSSTPCASSSFAGMVGGCRIPVPILLHLSPEEPLPACLPPSLGDLLNSQDLPLRLAWVLFLFSSLSPPFFCSPSEPTLPHAALQDGWGGLSLPVPHTPTGDTSPACRATVVTPIYSVRVQRTEHRGRQPAWGLEKSTES